uniref:Putative secreted protein n=1 Tax=Amblyomma triste TaxID=251400 RepID=A0A023G5R0_AMBTT
MSGILLLLLCLQECIGSRALAGSKRTPEVIGVGVTAHVSVSYDESYSVTPILGAELRDSGGADHEHLWPAFQALFEKVLTEPQYPVRMVQRHFNNQSVMIKMNLFKTSQNTSIPIKFKGMNKSVDGPQTLQNLIKYGESAHDSNDTIFYFLTQYPVLEENRRGDNVPRSLGEISTRATFCTTSVSAAVVRYDLTKGDYWSTEEATAHIMGVNTGIRIRPWERMDMKLIFSRCYNDTARESEEEPIEV